MIGPQHSRFAAAVTAVALVFLVVPLIVVTLFSFHSSVSLTFPFRGFSLQWYEEVFGSPEFRSAVWNSFVIAASVALTTLVLGTLAAYGLSRTRSRFRAPLALLFLLPISVPGLFIGIALLVFFGRIGADLSLWTIMLAHLVYVFPFFVLIALSTLDRVDPAREEAAADLGASPIRVFFTVTLPEVWPVLLAATCLAFALSFDEFVITFFVAGVDSTVPLLVWSMLRRTINPTVNVLSTLLLVTSLLLWIVAFGLAGRRGRNTGAPAPLLTKSETR